MCVSCGCGQPTVRNNPGDITADQITAAAEAAEITPLEVAQNISVYANTQAAGRIAPEGKGPLG